MTTLQELEKRQTEIQAAQAAKVKNDRLENEAAAVQAAIEKERKRLADEQAAGVKRFNELQVSGEKLTESLLGETLALMAKIKALGETIDEQHRLKTKYSLRGGLESQTGANQLFNLYRTGRTMGQDLALIAALGKNQDKRAVTWGKKYRDLFGV